MHANVRNAFSIKPENNMEDSPWQHLRTDRKSLALLGIYGKMIFDAIDSSNNIAEIKKLSLFTHEFKKGFQSFGITDVSSEIDLIFDTLNPEPENPDDNDSILEPVYYLKITLSGITGETTVSNKDIALKANPSILNCEDAIYVEKYKTDVEKHLNENGSKMNLKYTLYVDVVYIDSPEEKEDNIINILDFTASNNEKLESVNSVFSAKIDPAKGTLFTVKCRPSYVSLLY
jgi:hypothetical protein